MLPLIFLEITKPSLEKFASSIACSNKYLIHPNSPCSDIAPKSVNLFANKFLYTVSTFLASLLYSTLIASFTETDKDSNAGCNSVPA